MGEYAPDSARAQGSSIVDEAKGVLNPCARESKARIGRFVRAPGLLGEYAPDSATAEGSSVVDQSGEY